MRLACLCVLIAAGCSRSAIGVEPGPMVPIEAGAELGSGPASPGPGIDAGAAQTADSNLNCPPPSSTCTAEQYQPYTDCVLDRCDREYRACFGPSYRSGMFAGPCQTYVGCYLRCGCNDVACRSACGAPQGECQTCLIDLVARCVQIAACAPPACMGGGAIDAGGGGGSTCAELMSCCASIADASQKAQCQMFYEQLKAGGDQSCASGLMIYRANKLCQ